MIKLSLNTEKQFFELREEWETLLNETEDLDFFSTWEWNYCWWKNFREDKKLFLLTFRDNHNSLLGIFPGCILKYNYFGLFRLKVLQFIGRGIDQNSIGEYSDFLDVIAHREYKAQIYESLLGYLKSQRGLYDIIYLNVLKETSPFVSYLKNGDSDIFQLRRVEKDLPVYFASLPDNIDEYVKSLSSSFRASIRRKVRKWEKNHHDRLCVIEDSQSIEDFFNNFFSLVRERHKKIMSNERVRFHKDIANYCVEINRFLGISTKIKGKYSAVAVIYLFKDRAYFYQHAIDPQFSEHSPGTVLFYYMFKKIIQDGIKRLEFLHGKYDYKSRFGKDQHYLVNIYLGMGTVRSRLYFLLYTNIQRAKKFAKIILKRN
jgi:hypothetical protein